MSSQVPNPLALPKAKSSEAGNLTRSRVTWKLQKSMFHHRAAIQWERNHWHWHLLSKEKNTLSSIWCNQSHMNEAQLKSKNAKNIIFFDDIVIPLPSLPSSLFCYPNVHDNCDKIDFAIKERMLGSITEGWRLKCFSPQNFRTESEFNRPLREAVK